MEYMTNDTCECLKMQFDGKLDKLFDQWKSRIRMSNFVKDGVMLKNDAFLNVDIDKKWLNLPRRIVFLMKDQNQGEWRWDDDTRQWMLNPNPKLSNYDKRSEDLKSMMKLSSKTWHNLGILFYSLSYAKT